MDPASRTGYAYVRVNGDGYGVYLNVGLDKIAWRRSLTTDTGAHGADVVASDVRFEADGEAEMKSLEALGGGGRSDRSGIELLAARRSWRVRARSDAAIP